MSKNRAALYCRLSKEDGETNESLSISTQKLILNRYCDEHCWKVVDYYIDDGYSGTNFDRPDFNRMMHDIFDGRIDIVLVKDLSRFGRHYIFTGYYTELLFPQMNVRFVAVNDDVDTDNLNSSIDLAAYRNIINEMMARDISRKTKASFRAKAKNGEFLGSFAPYGYQKKSDITGERADRHQLVIDYETAEYVRLIFNMCVDGAGYTKIAETLNSKSVLNPTDYINKKHPGFFKTDYHQKDHIWNPTSVRKILNNYTYLGMLVQGRKVTQDYRTKKMVMTPEDQWITVKNTHEPIITEQLWNRAHEAIESRKRNIQSNSQIFAGLLKCGDCGHAMTLMCLPKRSPRFVCSQYRIRGKKASGCKSNSILYKTVYQYVLKQIQFYAKSSAEDEEATIKLISEKLHLVENNDNWMDSKPGISNKSQANLKLDTMPLLPNLSGLALKLKINEADIDNISSFVYLIRTYSYVKTLDSEILNALLDRIIIIGRDKENSKRIMLCFKYAGLLP